MSEQTAAIRATLRAARKRQGLSQEALGRRIGRATYQTIWQWENGANEPRLDNLREWAWALGYVVTLTPVAESYQAIYDAGHDPSDYHCLLDPCAWHPEETRIRPSPTFPATLLPPDHVAGASA